MICKHCGRPESDHCVFELLEIPDGCVCDPNTWDGEIAPICGEYQGDGINYCDKCEHDKACHKNSKEGI